MGTFKEHGNQRPKLHGGTAKNHQRTIYVEVYVTEADVTKLAEAVKAQKNISGAVVKRYTKVRLAYGPVQGAFPSDLRTFLDDRNIEYHGLTQVGTVHGETCRFNGCNRPAGQQDGICEL